MKRHNTVDKRDGRQETITSSGITHDFNSTIFQVLTKEGKPSLAESGKKKSDHFL